MTSPAGSDYERQHGAVRFLVLGPLDARGLPRLVSGFREVQVLALLLDAFITGQAWVAVEKLAALWDDAYSGRSRLYNQVERLRNEGGLGRLLVSKRGVGYRLALTPDQVDGSIFLSTLGQAEALLSRDAASADALLIDALALWTGAKAFENVVGVTVGGSLNQGRLTALRLRISAQIALGADGRPALAENLLAQYAAAGGTDEGQRQISVGIASWLASLTSRAAVHHVEPSAVTDPVPAALLLGGRSTQYTSRFAARDVELTQIEDCLARGRRGRGPAIALVLGELGAGKSRLVHEAVNRLVGRTDVVSLFGQCVYGPQSDSFLPFKEVLLQLEALPTAMSWSAHARSLLTEAKRALLPGHGSSPGSLESSHLRTGDRATAFCYLRDALAAISLTHPLVLLLEDLHWADRDTVALLHYLFKTMGSCAVTLLLTARTHDARATIAVGEATELVREIERLEGACTVRVGEEESTSELFVRAFLDANYSPNDFSPGFAADVASLCGDNALFLQEILLDLQAQGHLTHERQGWHARHSIDMAVLPARLEAAVSARLDGLGSRAAQLATAAALEGRVFHAQTLATVLGNETDSVTDEIFTNLVSESRLVDEFAVTTGSRHTEMWQFRFVHHLYVEVLRGRCGPIQRARLHRRLLDALDLWFDDDDPRVESARLEHAVGARDVVRSTSLGQRVARNLLDAHGAEAALTTVRRIIALDPLPDGRVALSLLEAEALEALGRYEEGLDIVRPLIGTDALGDSMTAHRRAVLHLASVLLRRTGAFQEARRLAELLHVGVSNAGDPHWTVVAARDIGRAAESQGEYQLSVGWYESALPLVGADDKLRAGILEKVAYSLYRSGELSRAADHYVESLRLADQHGDLGVSGSVKLNLGILRMAQGRLAEARALMSEGLAIRRRVGSPVPLAQTLTNLALAEALLGNPSEAGELIESAVATYRELGDQHHLAIALDAAGTVRLIANSATEAALYYEEALAIATQLGDVVRVTLTACNMVAVRTSLRDLETAAEWAARIHLSSHDGFDKAFRYVLGASVHYLLDEVEPAADNYYEAALAFEALGDVRFAARAAHNARVLGRDSVLLSAIETRSEDTQLTPRQLVPIPRM